MGSILFAASVGYVTGCLLHSVSTTQNSFYSDVIALNIAAILAALLTSIWVWKDWHVSQEGRLTEVVDLSTPCYRQKKIADINALPMESKWSGKRQRGTSITSKTPNFVAQRISDILSISIEQPNPTAMNTAWSTELLRTSLNMWNSGQTVLTISSRANLVDFGFPDAASFSTYEDGILYITTGFLLQSELDLPSWQPLHAYL